MTSVLSVEERSPRSGPPGTTPLASRLAALPPGHVDLHTHAIDPDLPDIGQAHPGSFPRLGKLGVGFGLGRPAETAAAAAGVTGPATLATARARRLWCDSLSYDAPALRLAAGRFGPGRVVLGTDYPFDAREQPGAASVRANTLALLAGTS